MPDVRIATALALSLALHLGLGLAPRVGPRARLGDPHAASMPIDFVMLPEVPKAPARVAGEGEDGIEPLRPTGAEAAEAPGRAGEALAGSAPRIRREGTTPRTRFSDREAPWAVLGAIAAGIAAHAGPLDTFDAREALGASPATTLGTRGGSIVAPGTHGLDMQGTGRGSRDAILAGERDVVGGPTRGPGWLGGAASERAIARGRLGGRPICVIEGCRPRPRHPVLRVRVVSGPLDPAMARRIVLAARAPLLRCLDAAPGPVELVIAASGTASPATGPAAACVGAVLGSVAFPVASAPSRLRIERRFAVF